MAAHSRTSMKDETSDRTLDTVVRRRGSRYALWGAFAIAGLVVTFLIFQLL